MKKSFVQWSVWLLLLMPATLVLGQTDEEMEDLFWKSVECKSARQVQAYLEVYPTGRYLTEAYACLEGQLGLDRAARRLVQQGLTALDYSVGAADGLFGPATRKALRDWQAGKGFTGTGYLTREQADTLIEQGREAVAARREAEERRPVVAEEQQSSSRMSPDQTCAGKSEGAECWMELANQAGCYVWNNHLQKDETVTWTGECSGGMAHGKGSLTWVYDGNKSVATDTGLLRSGKYHGDWVLRRPNGAVEEGPYVNDKRHGHWTIRTAKGTVGEGPYVDGKMQGHWVFRVANGTVGEGPFVGGKRHGHWVRRFADGTVAEGPYVDGKQHGHWVERFADGTVAEGPFVDGKHHGHWVARRADGTVAEGPYVDGKQHGRWVDRLADGSVVSDVPYVNGEPQYQ